MATEIAKTDKKLLNTHSFTISYKNSKGEEFSGSFTVHRPTIGELMRIGVKEASELGGLTNVDINTSIIAHMLASLDVVVDMKPEWWKPREMRDLEVLQEVYEKYLDYLRTFQQESRS
jgi:hypothetical protein